MSSIPEGLLEAARKDLGYREKNNGYTKFGDWYYANVDTSTPYFKTAPWCDMFITWAANQAGVQDYVGEFAYTVDHAKWFRKHDAWSDKPEPGALVFYDWSGSRSVDGIDHVGIVEKVEGRKIKTIEANVDGVWLKRKERDQGKVVGYGLPRKVREAKDGEEAAAGVPKPSDLVKPQIVAAESDAAATVRASASMAGVRSESDFGDLPAIQEAAVPALAVTALLCVALFVKLAADRTSSRGVVAGRYRRPEGRRRAAFT
ncbi:CHAP domain-containing protein [Streptosporangium canum]|uniref:CHAP domain-containing protein n=1 Tax=Streptosporangium canum TaxID=324952 RepID=UPI0036B66D3D